MRQARHEPTFASFELIAPSRPAGQTALRALDALDVSDAEFETVSASNVDAGRVSAPEPVLRPSLQHSLPGIGLLRQNIPFDSASFAESDTLSARFVAFTAISAFAVFWLCGGHALLY